MTTDLAAGTELSSAPEPMPITPNTPRALVARARAAAKAFQRPDEPLGWAEALGAAPWPKGAPPAYEAEFRRAFAEALVKRSAATEQRRIVDAAPDRVGRAAPRTKASAAGMRRLVSGSPQEFAQQERWAAAAGLSWAAWARRRLSSPQ